MNEKNFSGRYDVRKLKKEDAGRIYELCRMNDLYYRFCPPLATMESIGDDMTALPPGKTMESKYYVGYYEEDRLIAVLDLIDGYPEKEIVFIGLFMTDISIQNRGTGTEIINELTEYLCSQGYEKMQLAWVKGNPQAERFWLKNGFYAVRETSSPAAGSVILAEKILRQGAGSALRQDTERNVL